MRRRLHHIPIPDPRMLIPVQLRAPHRPLARLRILVGDGDAAGLAAVALLPRFVRDVVEVEYVFWSGAVRPAEGGGLPVDGVDEGGSVESLAEGAVAVGCSDGATFDLISRCAAEAAASGDNLFTRRHLVRC